MDTKNIHLYHRLQSHRLLLKDTRQHLERHSSSREHDHHSTWVASCILQSRPSFQRVTEILPIFYLCQTEEPQGTQYADMNGTQGPTKGGFEVGCIWQPSYCQYLLHSLYSWWRTKSNLVVAISRSSLQNHPVIVQRGREFVEFLAWFDGLSWK